MLGSTILEQVLVVEFVVHNQMCDNCHRREASDFWRAVVQIRQKVKFVSTVVTVVNICPILCLRQLKRRHCFTWNSLF